MAGNNNNGNGGGNGNNGNGNGNSNAGNNNATNKNIHGTAGDDFLEGNDANNKIYGDLGDDVLLGLEGNDHLFGEVGNDTLEGGNGNDKLEGGAGDDTLTGGDGNDNILAGAGDDQVYWRAGDSNDQVDGGDGEDTFDLDTSENETQTISLGVDEDGNIVISVSGAEGGDLVLSGIEKINLNISDQGASLILGPNLPPGIFGQKDEPLELGGGDDADSIDTSGSDQAVSVNAGGGDDTINTGGGSDIIAGGAGDDTINAGGGDDTVVWQAGEGNDTIDGGDGFDALDVNLDQGGDPGDPPPTLTITADANGNVILQSSTGETLTMKGVEDIVINAAPAGSTITIGDLTGTDIAQDTLYFVGGAGVDSLDASATDRRINAQGNGGDDILLSGAGNDLLDGGDGNDYLNAGSGSGVDTVLGGNGDDTIEVTLGDEQGSDAIDIVDGGADNDTLNVHFTEPTPHDLFLNINSNGDGSFTMTSEDIDVVEEVHVSNVENLIITADEPGLNYNLGTLSDTTLQNVSFQGSEGHDSFNGSGTDVSVSLSGNGGDDNLIGGSQGDYLVGGAGNDSLDGEGGNDWLIGGEGNDILDGGADWDTADYSSANGGVAVDLSNNQAQDTLSAGIDTLVNVEAVEGSAFADTLTGNDNDNYLSGNDGDDVITGGAGFDILRGGAGNDTLTATNGRISGDAGNDILSGPITYRHDGNGVAVNMSGGDIEVGGDTIAGGSARDGYGDTDTLDTASGFVEGSNFGDHLEGSDGNQVFFGRAGNDTLRGNGGDDTLRGGSGDDVLDGGDGVDFVSYFDDGQDTAGAGTGVTVNLAAGTATDNWGNTDTLSNIENVIGSFMADTITGDANDNVIFTLGGGDTVAGGAGNDTLIDFDGDSVMDGGDGDDILIGARGNDTLTGGSGADTYRFTTTEFGDTDFGHDTITDFDVAEDVLDLTPFTDIGAIEQLDFSEDGGNTVISIDADRSITLNGVSAASLVAANFIFGGEEPPPPATIGTEGNDVLEGTPGMDVLQGMGGNDQLEGSAGDDILDGGDGGDIVFYRNDPAGVDVNLATGFATDGYGDTDTLIAIENIAGSEFADTLTGNSGNNTLLGWGGDDIINGGDGDDRIFGGPGNDQIDGGAGFDQAFMLQDTLTLPGPKPQINIVYNGDGTITTTNTGNGDVDTYANVEALFTSLGPDVVTGDALDSIIGVSSGLAKTVDGGGGNDTLVAPGTTGGARVDMNAGTIQQQDANGQPSGTIHNFSNIENIVGTAGNDTLIGDGGDNILEGGNGFDNFIGGAGNDTFNGGLSVLLPNPFDVDDGATDTANYLQDPAGIIADMVAGTVQDGYGGTDTLFSIENIQGSNFADTIIGNAGNNSLSGNGGVDTIFGGDGDDAIVGGAGIDILDGGAGRDTVFFSRDGIVFQATGLTIEFNNADNTISSFNPGTGETEIVDNFELVFGTLGHDQITGDDGDNFISGLLGNDVIDGGAGNDTAWFFGQVTVDLAAGTAAQANPFFGTMSLANIENIVGTAADDSIAGDAGNNILEGGAGNDLLRGGAGNDTLHGGMSLMPVNTDPENFGVDTADYSQDGAGVTVDLGAGTATDGSGGSDTLIAIDNVIGSAFNDTLIGDDNANELEGLGGDDILTGGAGADSFRLTDDGNDNAAFGLDVITDFDLVEDRINLRAFSNLESFNQLLISQDGADTLITFDAGNSVRLQGINAGDLDANHFDFVENQFIEGNEGNDILEGDEGNDTIFAYGGNDQVRGFGGNDNIDGGTGNDNLWGGDGNDIIEGGPGWDNIYGEGGNDILTDSADGGYLNGGDGDDLLTAINSNANMDGGAGNDTLTGASGWWNHMRGEEGDDILIDPDGSGFLFGGPGNDSLDGQVNYSEDPAGIYANLAGASWDVHNDEDIVIPGRTVFDGWGDTDTLQAGTLQLYGSNHDDFVQAAPESSQNFNLLGGNDTLIAGSGSVWVNMNSGNDYLDGGADWDGLDAWEEQQDSAGPHTQGILVNLSGQDFEYEAGMMALANRLIDPWGFTDEVYNFESVNGTTFDDVIIGGDDHNWLEGREGNDRLFGGDISGDNLIGGPGDDYLDGQGGDWDTAWYNHWLWDENGQINDAPGIVADLSTGTVQDQYGGTDILVSIENIEGSPYDDLITGDANRNSLWGNDGDDVIHGGAGDDNLEGRNGNDELFGEDGNDWLLGQQGDDLIDGGAGEDQVNYDGWSGTTSGVNIDLNVITDAGGYTNVVVVMEDGLNGTDYLRGIEHISGTDHNDTLVGDDANNNFHGHAGNDILVGGAGNDWLDGGDDFDNLDGGAGFDNLTGGENDDFLTGGSDGDVFHFSRFTNQGNPTSFGADIITDFNPAEDTLDFNRVPEFSSSEALQSFASEDGEGDLVLSFTSNDFGVDETNSITLQGITLADLPNLNIWYSPILGTDGNDVINGGPGSEFIQALGGDDTVNGGDGNDDIDGGAGNDILNGGNGQDHFRGGSGNDIIDGGADWDHVDYGGHSREFINWWQQPFTGIVIDMNEVQQVLNDGFGGTDTLISIEGISGTDFDDSFTGGSGPDNFTGNAGNDIITGNEGDDFFHGNDGDDTLSGGTGNDWFKGGQGNDHIDGGADWDHVDYNDWQQVSGVTVDLAANQASNDGFGNIDTLVGIESVSGSEFADVISGDANDNNLSGFLGNDVLNGNGGNDNLHGDDGDDVLDGGDGNDGLNGANGNDILIGGLGDDYHVGGAGDDLFIFSDGDIGAWDHIDDFTPGPGSEDVIDLQGIDSLNNFSEVYSAASEDPQGTQISLGNGNILHLQGVSLASLHEDDFFFG